MIEIKKINDLNYSEQKNLFHRYGKDYTSVMDSVIPIVNDVKENGDEAVKRYTKNFDGVEISKLVLTHQEIEKGFNRVPAKILDAFIMAKDNIEEFHLHQKPKNIAYTRDDGSRLGVIYQPVEKVAIYAPGGKAIYPSTILMAAIPAIIAGSSDITVITPPCEGDVVPDIILAICRIVGIDKIIVSGGAQGIAAAGFGTQSISKADIIVGPGNLYVTAAKAYLFSLGLIQIDSMAGPSDVMIIADEGANPKWIAFDLLSQAEHSEDAFSILITTSSQIAESVKEEISKDIEAKTGRYEIVKKSVTENGLILLADSLEQAIEFSNRFAPEHMELMVSDPDSYLPKIKNVGSLFLGHYSPVAVGDYFSGTNHILPTGGTARFSSGLSVDSFLRRTTYQHLTGNALKTAMEPVGIMSKVEGFDSKHGGSIYVRYEEDQPDAG